MIINAQQSNVQTYGDIKEFKTGIDPKNLEFITTLLSSNLYSDPEQSFIREIVSNAWDSHVEAGTTDIPVIVRLLDKGYGNRSVTIRDYGTGLSPERFKEVYCNIGSSTKRESNEFIGGFGIGKYSSLACSNTVYITSYYEGTAYYYIMVKSGNAITTNLLMEKPTTEKNGVEITIKNINDLSKYRKALDYIVFFPNVFVDGIGNDINSTKLKTFTNFAVANIKITPKLLLGNVLYPCNESHLSQESRDFLWRLQRTGIVVKFNVGELNITPNRESIIYTSDTIKKINARLAAAKEEIEKMVSAKVEKDYDDIVEYYDMLNERHWYDPISDTVSGGFGSDGYPIRFKDDNIDKITYNGKNLLDVMDHIQSVLWLTPPNFKGVVYNDKLCKTNIPYGRKYDTMRSNRIVILNAGVRMSEAIKRYMKDTWEDRTIVSDFTLAEFKDYVDTELKGGLNNIPEKDIIVEGIYNRFIKKAVRVDLNSEPEYLAIKASMSTRGQNIADEREVILRVAPKGAHYVVARKFNRFSNAVEFIKNLKKGVILTNMDGSEELFSGLADWKGFTFIKARKDVVKNLKSLGLSCLVDIDWVTEKDHDLKKLSAILQVFNEGMDRDILYGIIPTIPEELAEEFKAVVKLYGRSNNMARVQARKVSPDPHTMEICHTMRRYIGKYKEAISIVGSSECVCNAVLIHGVIIKKRLYRVNSETYNRFRQNNLIRILCRK